MGTYIARRLWLMLPSLLGISITVFLLMRLIPGDVVDTIIAESGLTTLPPEVVASLRRTMGLDEPLHIQYLTWMWDLLHGDLGYSLRSKQPVTEIIRQRLPITVELAFLSLTLSVIMAVPLGVISAIRRNSPLDFLLRIVSLLGLSIPNFWLAILLILVSSRYLGWLPPLIYVPFTENPIENLQQMMLPAITLATSLMAVTTRMTRSAMLEVLHQDYIKTARAKGLRERSVTYHHALKNASMPIVTVVGIQMGNLLGGTIIIEQIFGLPGIGWMILNAIFQRDYPVVQGGVLFVAVVFLVVNLFVDVLYAFLDPRIKYS